MTTNIRRIIISASSVIRARKLVKELLVGSLTRVTEKAVDEPPESIQAITEVNVPTITPLPTAAEPQPDYYDILDDGTTPTEGYTISYEATYDGTTFTVERDLFGPGDFPHNYGGWPMPGEPYPPI